MNFKVSQLKSLTAGEVAVDDLIYVIDSNPTDGSVKSKKVTVGDLIDSRIYGISSSQFVLITGYYADPSWISSLDWSKITNAPSFVTSLSALTDVQLSTPLPGQALVYNGTKWVNQGIGELDTLATVTTRGNTTTNSITVGGLTSNASSTIVGAAAGTIGTRVLTVEGSLPEIWFKDTFSGVDSFVLSKYGSAFYFARTTSTGVFQSYSGAIVSASWSFGHGTNPAATVHVRGANVLSSAKAFLVQNSSPSDLLTIWNDGAVGINTSTNAGFKLDVNGTVRLSGNVTVGDGSTTAANRDIIFVSNRFIRFQDSGLNFTNWYGNSSNFRHTFGFNGDTLFDMRYDSSFNIGLAGVNQYSLALRATSTESQIEGYRTAFGANVKPLRIFTSNPFANLGQTLSSGNIFIQTGTGVNGGASGKIVFQIGNSTNNVAEFATSGNLLVGTTSDSGYKLDVNGSLRTTGILYSNNNLAVGNYDSIISPSGSVNLSVYSNVQGTPGRIVVGGYVTAGPSLNGIISFVNTQLNNYPGQFEQAKIESYFAPNGSTGGDLRFYTRTYSYLDERLRITDSGNILINTTTDSGFRLAVNGTARVTGNLTLGNNTDVNILFGSSSTLGISGGKININNNTSVASNFSVGTTSLSASARFLVGGSISLAGDLGRAMAIESTITANANNAVLVGLDINPTFTNGAFTGVSNYGIRLQNSRLALFDAPIYSQAGASGSNTSFSITGTAGSSYTVDSSRNLIFNTGQSMYFNTDTDGGSAAERAWYFAGARTGTTGGRTYSAITVDGSGFPSLTIYNNDNGPRIQLNSNAVSYFNGGNLLVGTTTDAGFKLDVNGTGRFTGNLTVSTGGVGTNTFNANVNYLFANQNNVYGLVDLQNAAGQNVFLKVTGTPTAGTGFDYFWISGTTTSSTIGTTRNIFNVSPTYNLTGAFTGTMRGFYYNPTLTSMTGAVHRAIETTSGDVVFNGGNVGIGTSNPTSKLYLDGGLFTKKYYTDTSSNTVNFGSAYELFGTPHASSGYTFYINPTGWSSGWDVRIGNTTTSFDFSFGAGFSAFKVSAADLSLGGGIVSYYKSSPASGFAFASGGGWDFVIRGTSDEKLRIKAGGNVLIGTTTDSGYKLDVSGTARVLGALLAENVPIRIQNNSPSTNTAFLNINRTGHGSTSTVGSQLMISYTNRSPGGLWSEDRFSNVVYSNTAGAVTTGFEWYVHNNQVESIAAVLAMSINGKTLSVGTNTPQASAVFQADSTTQGFLAPRMTTAQKNAITSPATGLEVYDSTTNTPNYFNGTMWVGVASNQSTGLSPGLFSQTSDSVAVTNTTVESSLISTGVGTLSVPANGFQVGAAYIAYLSGVMSSQNNATMEIHLRSNGFVLADTDPMILSATTGKFWELHVNFVIRAIGGGGVAAIVTSGRFSYNKDSGNTPESIGFSDVNNTTFDTTINNTLAVTATWGNASPSNSIQTRIFNLYRVY
jgi:hypothetical protein